jgi:small-conductance mechanosensitive channel
MEPLTTSAIAALTLVLSKALENTGETLGEKVMEQASKAMQLLKGKSPETAGAIELAAKNPDLVVEEPEDYGVAVLVEKVEQEAKADSELRVAIEDLAGRVQEAAKSDIEVAAALDALTETLKAQRQSIKKPDGILR